MSSVLYISVIALKSQFEFNHSVPMNDHIMKSAYGIITSGYDKLRKINRMFYMDQPLHHFLSSVILPVSLRGIICSNTREFLWLSCGITAGIRYVPFYILSWNLRNTKVLAGFSEWITQENCIQLFSVYCCFLLNWSGKYINKNTQIKQYPFERINRERYFAIQLFIFRYSSFIFKTFIWFITKSTNVRFNLCLIEKKFIFHSQVFKHTFYLRVKTYSVLHP